MSQVHYFQRYSSPENTVTNNTLLLLARIYDYSPRAASTLLSGLTGEAIQIGIEIAQQRRAQVSVPDGVIIQRSFKVLIEAKVDAPADINQLLRHAESFGREAQKVLLLITKRVDRRLEQQVSQELKKTHPDVVFCNVTYEDICKATSYLFREYESQMADLIDDYAEYCNEAQLFDQSRFLMRVVPCGTSVDVNRRFSLYFHPSDRGYTEHRFVGIYASKSVKAVLEPEAVFDVALMDGVLSKSVVQGMDDGKYDDAIRHAIGAAREECGYDLTTGNRFFCGSMMDTDFQKESPYGIQGPRILNLADYLEVSDELSLSAVAAGLRGRSWK